MNKIKLHIIVTAILSGILILLSSSNQKSASISLSQPLHFMDQQWFTVHRDEID